MDGLEQSVDRWARNRVPVAAINRPAVLLHLEKKTIRFPAVFPMKQGTNGLSTPCGSATSPMKPDTTLTNIPRWQSRTRT